MTTATDPRAAHLDTILKAEDSLAKVQVWLAKQAERQNVNWANVGDVNYVAARLGEIVGFVNIAEPTRTEPEEPEPELEDTADIWGYDGEHWD